MSRLFMFLGGCALSCALGLAGTASAQGYPQRPITFVVPFAPGGGSDSLGRELAKLLGERLGQSVVVDNRGGAGGAIAAGQVSQSKPDGYTLLMVTSTFVTVAATDRKLPYDILKDFSPIAMLGRGPLLLVVNKDIGISTVAQLVEAAKGKPDAFNYVSAGPGSINHLAGELFVQRTGARMAHIPYKGSGPATMDLIGGQAQVFFATVPTILGQVKGGKVRLIAATSGKRSRIFPEVPTVQESGVRDFQVETWWGIVGPPGLPADVVAVLNKAINEAAASPEMRKRFESEGAEQFSGTPGDLQAVLRDELESWRRVVREGGLKLD
ncbi:MAG TPA: tripartite tricarboxylate transporter substrate binding protein [Usitatibacter sp.]|nr:tripartite tricarboxylate transporter substrate binding protein [Usitatibacter sp.]